MKLRFSFFVVPALAFVFCPVTSHSQTEEKSSPSLEQRVADLEKRVEALESIPAVAMALKFSSKSSPTASAQGPRPARPEAAPSSRISSRIFHTLIATKKVSSLPLFSLSRPALTRPTISQNADPF